MEKNIKNSKDSKKLIINIAIVIAVLALYFILDNMMAAKVINKYYGRVINMIGINVILAVSLNIIIGFTGQLALGHAGFMSIGAYTAAMMTLKLHSPLLISILVGAIVASIVAALFGYPILRLKGDYLAICTLGLGEIIKVIIQNVEALGGPRGIPGIPTNTNFTWIFFTMVLVIIIVKNIITSSQGRAMLSVREDEIAAEAMGINTTKYKLIAFSLGAFFAAVAGGLYAHYLAFIDPVSFNFMKSIEILTFVVFGGMGSLSGTIISATGLTFLLELLRNLSEAIKDLRMIIYPILLIVMMLFRPQGLLGTKELPDLFKKSKSKSISNVSKGGEM